VVPAGGRGGNGAPPQARRAGGLIGWLRDPDRRARVISLGAAGGLSYAIFKGLKLSVVTFSAWYVVAMRTGASPVGQWPRFLSTYASMYIAGSAGLQPLKFAVVLALTPKMDRMIDGLIERHNVQKGLVIRWMALAIAASLGLLTAIAVLLASYLSGVPLT